MLNHFIIKDSSIHYRSMSGDIQICKVSDSLSETESLISILNVIYNMGYEKCEEDYKIKHDKICDKLGI